MNAKIGLGGLDLIVFDMDGVILNMVDAVKRTFMDGIKKWPDIIKGDPERIIEELAQLIEKLISIPIPKIILNAKELFNVSFISDEDATVLKKLEIAAFLYKQFKTYKVNSEIYEGIDKLIRYLKGKGKKLAILTNNKREYTVESLDKYNLTEYFDEIIGYNETEKMKPDPAGLIKILKDLGIKNPGKAVFIGDMTSDIICGKRAGVKTIAVYSGLSRIEDLKSENPDYLVNNTKELAALFGLNI